MNYSTRPFGLGDTPSLTAVRLLRNRRPASGQFLDLCIDPRIVTDAVEGEGVVLVFPRVHESQEAPLATQLAAAAAPSSPTLSSSLQTIGMPYDFNAAILAGICSTGSN